MVHPQSKSKKPTIYFFLFPVPMVRTQNFAKHLPSKSALPNFKWYFSLPSPIKCHILFFSMDFLPKMDNQSDFQSKELKEIPKHPIQYLSCRLM